ncbi:MAG: stage IV sporulation protein A [Bacteroides sp.]|nr:stage IV sporulation protein A [Eubacterium sp.]MCM1419190.1 stage IV sporulation protein A [Roseburia sp.]MCM1463043.1 stage IV sporulation protein A [Bacteroides sp.]
MNHSIYHDIARRTDGNIYIGVVGPVRSGKSTFISRFMQSVVIPNIDSGFRRERAIDELPQGAAGKTIMTTEPKFVPEDAISIRLEDSTFMNVRLIDCVGYIVPSAIGYIENDQPRMVMTPWFDTEIPFNMAAEVGTQKVINEHSTIGLVITTDGTISDIPRAEYAEAEERVVEELNNIRKPFAVVLNTKDPEGSESKALAAELSEKYGKPVIPVNCLEVGEQEIKDILREILLQFPVKEINIRIPKWLTVLEKDHWLKREVFNALKLSAAKIHAIGEIKGITCRLSDCEYVTGCGVEEIDLGKGAGFMRVEIKNELFYRILGEATGIELHDEGDLMPCMIELAAIKKRYEKVKAALDEVQATGYGIVMPGLDELSLAEPEIVKQGGKYGVRLRAQAPSIHMMAANIETEVSPIVGSERQSEELIHYLLNEFEENPTKIWESNIFGKSLHELVNEGLHNKLYRMPSDARQKLQETIERIINEGCGGLICIIL